MKKRVIPLLLAVSVLFSLLPITTISASPFAEAQGTTTATSADLSPAPAEKSAQNVRKADTDVAYSVEGGNIYFDKASGTITDCDDTVTAANIPAEIDGVAVTSIGYSVFSGCSNLTSATIPDSVTSIGMNAFKGCTNLTSVTIPDSVTSVGSSAFEGCSSLASVTIPDGVTSIGDAAFSGCSSLTYVTIPDSVTSIGGWAFSHCTNLTSVTIHDSVTSIGVSAFYGCTSLTGIWVNENNPNYSNDSYGVLFNKEKTELIQAPCTISGEYILPNSVTSVGDNAFTYCPSLTSVTIPDSVTSISDGAFANCSSLTSVTIGKSVESIPYGCFYACRSLTSISIPDGVKSISSVAFEHCTGLTSVTIGGGVTSIGHNAFYDTALYNNADNWINGVFYIGSWLIEADNSISGEYSILNGTVGIAGDAFDDCTSLTNVTIPNGVTIIDRSAFYDCSSLTSATIPDSVTNIGGGAFYGCSSLTSVTIPDSVTNIGGRAFYGTALYNNADNWINGVFYIGSWLIDVDTSIVGECSILNGTVSIAEDAFYDCSNLTSMTIPDSVTSIGSSAFSGCSSLTSVAIPDSVTSIGDYAFMNCTGLTSVTIPDSVTSISNCAFKGCTNLMSVTISDSVTSIGDAAFYDCSDLTDVYFCGNAPEIGEDVFRVWVDGEYVNINGLTLYYIDGKDGWTNPTWNGYPTAIHTHTHSSAGSVTAPTCTGQGYTTNICDDCGVTYADDYVDALEHNFVDGECTRCGELDPNYVPSTEPSVEPTEPPVDPTEPEEIPSSNFKDVAKNAWYKESVDYAVAKGLMNGMGNNTFEPDTATNRAMLVTILWRYAGSPMDGTNDFTDVPNGQWFTQAVAWAAKNGIVTGVGNNKFDPEGELTREQLATILFRYSKLQELDTSARAEFSKFEDGGKVQNWSKEAVQWAVAEGIIGGTSENGKLYLDPQGNATRAQVATILMRFIENVLK